MTTSPMLPTLDGRVVLPGDDGYDAARTPWNTAVDLRPAAVVDAASVADVQVVVAAARAQGLRVAPQSTGHGAEALHGDLRDAILLRTTGFDALAIDPERRVARIGAGVTAGALARAAAAHGLGAPVGLAPSVGVAGLALGGGMGWLSRAHGLTSNHIISLDVVTADGEARRVDHTNNPELFYALRGGGGRFALVTGLELALHPVGELSAGTLAWPAARFGDVLEQARRVALAAPDAFSLVVRMIDPPGDVPRMVVVTAAHLGPHHDGERLIASLRGDATLSDTYGPIGLADLAVVAGDPEDPGPSRGDGLLLEDLTPDAARAIAEVAADADLGVLEIRQLGGALRRAPAGHGALATVDAGWAFFAGGFAPDAGAAARVTAALDRASARLAPFAARQVLLNARAAGADPAAAFDPSTWSRLQEIHTNNDPDGLLVAAHGA